jgi:hypothetical protein
MQGTAIPGFLQERQHSLSKGFAFRYILVPGVSLEDLTHKILRRFIVYTPMRN